MAEENEQGGPVRVQIIDLAGYVPGVVTKLSSRDVAVLEKKGAVKRLKDGEAPSKLAKADKKQPAANAKKA